ncbi:probable Werner syndrome ATP-dependent helicase homolog 1 [Orbicella faveolata]|uniref:probable Werner syndrome ATP-dependent helicase homolog 1 n=1 Tax=Orbicella faveolata TaxID=48498 RepID=UPI0009E29BFA|nr:probable Werner syndrome ATP-dependent helicase homolog 1 [Orbicella faveolata]
MTSVKTIRMSPDKRNVKYIVEKAKNELQDTFGWLISDMVNNAHAEKTVVFCLSLKACDIYDTFQHFLPCKSKVAMYHSKTPQDIKDNVLSDLMSPNGNIHLVIATSALGMGVNIPNIKRVVIFGVPENMESYLQAVGRGGRDGSDVLSIIFYHAYHLCHCDPTMRAFVKNKVNCRHGEILQFVNEKIEKPSILHKCCDVCSKQCNCGACPEEMFKICSELDNCPCTLERQVNTDERGTFTEVLKDLAVTCQANISVFGSFAAEILVVVNDIFNDVEETTHLKELCEMDWSDCEEFLLSIPEQYPPDSEESDCDL